jgi:hypothetical protein
MIRIQFSHSGKLAEFAASKRAAIMGAQSEFITDVQQIVLTQQVRERFAGKDRFGQAMPPRRRPRKDGAAGAVLSPHGGASRTLAGFFVKVEIRPGGWRLLAGYSDEHGPFPDRGPGVRTLIYHAQGIRTRTGIVKRDVLGISPTTKGLIRREFGETPKRIARARSGSSGFRGLVGRLVAWARG